MPNKQDRENYVGQLRGMTGADGDLPALHDITGCTT